MSQQQTILIFPGGMPSSLAYLDFAQRAGMRIIGASSLRYDTARHRYPAWEYLPFVTDDDFLPALRALIRQHGIDGIYTPNLVIWPYLDKCIRQGQLATPLLNPPPANENVLPHIRAQNFADTIANETFPLPTKHNSPALQDIQYAAIFLHFDRTPGHCDHDKLLGLCHIFRHMPSGDLVEIGSLYGKSAVLLSALARAHGIGNLLCIDPWSREYYVQQDEKGLVDSLLGEQRQGEDNTRFSIFLHNVLPYAQGDLNYLRLPSVEAARVYQEKPEANNEFLGKTRYQGEIALLHIDGNHHYDHARADIDAWQHLVAPGGWIVLDDYIWPYGNGPQRVGDEFLREQSDNIAVSFVIGGALFIQITNRRTAA